MTKQNKTTKQQFKLGDKVFIHSLKQSGKLYAFGRDMGKTAKVEIITKFDRETGERTTKLVTVNTSDLRPYRKPTKRQSPKYNPNEMFYMVKDFQKAFNHPVAAEPNPLTPERLLARQIWTAEELVEGLRMAYPTDETFEEAIDEFIKGIEVAKEKSLKDNIPQTKEDKIVGQADALVDALYFIFGSFVELGVQPFNLFKIVQQANMGKLHVDENGKKYAKYRESDGKIQKPENWERDFAPEGRLKAEVKRQIKRATK